MNLKKIAITNSIWSFLTKFSVLFLEFSTQIFLARILLPSDFGVFAIILIFISFGRAINHAGLGQALIQKNNISYLQECSIFYFNLFIGFILTIMLILFSDYISYFYRQESLALMLKVVSVFFLINSLSIIQDAKLTKSFKFKFKFFISFISILLSSLISIYLAYIGYGVWALINHIILSLFIRTIILWFISPWRPSLIFSWVDLKELLFFGINILISSVSTALRINMFSILIGKAYGVMSLGYYTKANQIQNLTSKTLTTSIQNVLFPIFSSLQEDKKELGKALQTSILFLSFLIFPIMIFISINAEDIIIVLLTDKWLESSYYLQLICIVGIIYPLQMMNLNALKSIGLSTRYRTTVLMWDFFSIMVALLTFNFGIKIMIIGQIMVNILSVILNIYFNGKYYEYNLYKQVKDLIPLILMNIIFYLLLNYIVINLSFINIFYIILIKLLVSIILYTILGYFFCKNLLSKFLIELKNLLMNIKSI